MVSYPRCHALSLLQGFVESTPGNVLCAPSQSVEDFLELTQLSLEGLDFAKCCS